MCLFLFLDIGFSPAEFVGVERAGPYSVQAGYLSGRPEGVGIFLIQLEFGSAGEAPQSLLL